MELTKERLLDGFASAQGMEADMLMGKVDITTHQAIQPMFSNAESPAEQIDIAVLVATAQEDHDSGEWGAQVESEASGEATPLGRGLAPSSGFGPMGSDVARRDALQGRHVVAVVPLPDLGLPKRVEPFDGVLEPGLAWGREYRNHPQGQTQPADAPDRVCEG